MTRGEGVKNCFKMFVIINGRPLKLLRIICRLTGLVEKDWQKWTRNWSKLNLLTVPVAPTFLFIWYQRSTLKFTAQAFLLERWGERINFCISLLKFVQCFSRLDQRLISNVFAISLVTFHQNFIRWFLLGSTFQI